jgi:hypothetical protein
LALQESQVQLEWSDPRVGKDQLEALEVQETLDRLGQQDLMDKPEILV